jgi:hypothetical protein
MNIKFLEMYLRKCYIMEVQPTWKGLKEFVKGGKLSGKCCLCK